MTDTEILDYLQGSLDTAKGRGVYDVQIGSVVFTIGVGNERSMTLRERFVAAIKRDQVLVAERVARALKG